MSQKIVFVGDPGSCAVEMLSILHESKITPKRAKVTPNLPKELADDPPAAIILGEGLTDCHTVIRGLREENALTSVPLLAILKSANAQILEEAFRCGIDDYLVAGVGSQFKALVALLGNNEAWSAMGAPAGRVILAHDLRDERIRLGRVLRRNGYDIHFAATTAELMKAVDDLDARAVVTASALEGISVTDVIKPRAADGIDGPAWILVSPAAEIDELKKHLETHSRCAFFETGADAEGITFLMNELLTPPPLGARRTPRILYGTPITFKPIGGAEPFFGYTFNMNMGGLYIRSLTGLPMQTQIEIEFSPPSGRGRVVAHAQVVWSKGLGNQQGNASPPGMGIQLIDVWPADLAAIEAGYEILQKQAEEKGTPLL